MAFESLIRLFSIALFGALCAALVTGPEVRIETEIPSISSIPSIQQEIESLEEVHQINTGAFRPYEVGHPDLGTDEQTR